MANNEEPTISMAGINAPPLYRLVEDGDKTVIMTADTNTPMWVINGKIGGDTVETMTTAERTAITPEAGQLIYDTDEGALYVGDGVTAGGIPVGSGGGGGGGTPATVEDIMTGSGASKILTVTNIRGALTAGQAVDVTSQPDGVAGDYRGTFTVTGSLGFGAFPKYASGLNYLMIADLTATTSGTVTPSGTWLDGTTTAKSLAAGVPTRVAMTFNAANKAKFTFSSTGAVEVSNCREYEVTACSAEAVAYIASLSNPDAFAAYYLVKADMVQPWTYIIDMGNSPAVTIASGLSYKLNASTGTHTLTVDTCPAGYDGRDAIIRIRLGGTGVIQAVAPLQLGGALVPYAINNCVVRFRDGEAVLLVEDTLAGYVVSVNSGTGEGSLPYGLAASGVPYIAFSPSTDGIPVDLSGATTAAEEVTVVGNGYTETILTGAINCTSKTTVANLALSDVGIMGGTLTLGDAFIPSGSTVAVSSGGLAVEKVTGEGSGSVIDLGYDSETQTGGTNIVTQQTGTFHASGVTFQNGSASYLGGAVRFAGSVSATVLGCTFMDNVAQQGAAFGLQANANCSCYLSGCTFAHNSAQQGTIVASNGIITLKDCVFSGNTAQNSIALRYGAKVILDGIELPKSEKDIRMESGSLALTGSNHLGCIVSATTTGSGTVTLTSGAVLDLTGNTNATPIAPGGGITFESGGATVFVNGGTEATSSSYMLDNITLPAGAKLTNTNVVNLGRTVVVIPSGATASASGVEVTSGNGNLRVESNARLELTSCNITSGTSSYGAALYVAVGGTARLTGCTLHDNTGGNAVYVRTGSLYMSGCSCSDTFTVRDAAVVTLAGENTLRKITSFNGSPTQSNATVTISSGASIALTEQINFGGNITVLDGGCTVNGNTIPAGTYTSINSNGQPT